VKLFLKHIIFVFALLFISGVNLLFGQTYSLKQKSAETDLKIICDSAYFFMDRKDVVVIIKKLEKQNKKNYKQLIKKMNGVCFEAINLRKTNDDADIAILQKIFLSDIIFNAIQTKKVAIQWKKSNDYLNTVLDKSAIINISGVYPNATTTTHTIFDANGVVLFDPNK
jgi:hypothetical protein